MPITTFGEAAPRNFVNEVAYTGERQPGLGWEISEQTFQELESIERNIRSADQQVGIFLLD